MGEAAPARGPTKGEVYRWLRLVHGWLSATAFLALIFFAATGILLNHPSWLEASRPRPVESNLQLTAQERAQVAADPDPGRRLANLVGRRAELEGAYVDGQRVGHSLFVRMQGVRGTSDLQADLTTGAVAVLVEPEHPAAVLNALHRAEHAGGAWRLVVDLAGGLLIAMALAGYLIFLSLRFRLTTALVLTGVSLAAMLGVFWLAVP